MSPWHELTRAEDVRLDPTSFGFDWWSVGGGITVRALQVVADLAFVGDGEILTEQSTFCVTTVHKKHDKPA